MSETEPYDVRRNLKGHKALPLLPKRNCDACADVTCLYNTTTQAVLRALEENPMTSEIEQWTCDDRKDDPIAMSADLRNLDKE